MCPDTWDEFDILNIKWSININMTAFLMETMIYVKMCFNYHFPFTRVLPCYVREASNIRHSSLWSTDFCKFFSPSNLFVHLSVFKLVNLEIWQPIYLPSHFCVPIAISNHAYLIKKKYLKYIFFSYLFVMYLFLPQGSVLRSYSLVTYSLLFTVLTFNCLTRVL